MKLGSLKAGGRDGTLIVVDRALQYYVTAGDVAPTMQSAMDSPYKNPEQEAERSNAAIPFAPKARCR